MQSQQNLVLRQSRTCMTPLKAPFMVDEELRESPVFQLNCIKIGTKTNTVPVQSAETTRRSERTESCRVFSKDDIPNH
jgi:hypothetical protein